MVDMDWRVWQRASNGPLNFLKKNYMNSKKTYNPYRVSAFPENYPPNWDGNGTMPPHGGLSEAEYLAGAVVSNSVLVPFAGSNDEVAFHVYDLVEALIRERIRRSERFKQAEAANLEA
jgi:hypothetical protein